MTTNGFGTNLFGQTTSDPRLLPHSDIVNLSTRVGSLERTIAPAADAWPANPTNGQLFYENDADILWVFEAPGTWRHLISSGAWADWTPTLTQNVTVTKTVQRARYTRIGRTVHAQFAMAVTGAGTAGAGINVGGLPLTAAATLTAPGTAWIYDASTAVRYVVVSDLGTTTSLWFLHDTSGGNVFGTTPAITLASGDEIRGTITYEMAG